MHSAGTHHRLRGLQGCHHVDALLAARLEIPLQVRAPGGEEELLERLHPILRVSLLILAVKRCPTA